jgi:hypothetical protein
MGSWSELDAVYPPGALTPAGAFVLACAHLEGAHSMYADPDSGQLASYLPAGISYDAEFCRRSEQLLRDLPLDEFLARAADVLNRQQKFCLALNLLDRTLAAQTGRRDLRPQFVQLSEGLGISMDELQPHIETLRLKNEVNLFPQ